MKTWTRWHWLNLWLLGVIAFEMYVGCRL